MREDRRRIMGRMGGSRDTGNHLLSSLHAFLLLRLMSVLLLSLGWGGRNLDRRLKGSLQRRSGSSWGS